MFNIWCSVFLIILLFVFQCRGTHVLRNICKWHNDSTMGGLKVMAFVAVKDYVMIDLTHCYQTVVSMQLFFNIHVSVGTVRAHVLEKDFLMTYSLCHVVQRFSRRCLQFDAIYALQSFAVTINYLRFTNDSMLARN